MREPKRRQIGRVQFSLDERALSAIAGTAPRLGSPYVCWHGTGDRYLNVSSRFGAIFKAAQRKARIERQPIPRRFRFHDLRHWYAVDFLRRGGSIYRLQQLLRHSSIKTTEIYLRYLTPEEAERSKIAM
jgi:integrase/recombinase XerD